MFLTDPRSAPPVASTLTVGAALLLSTMPSLLPRAGLIQGPLTGGLVLLALTLLAAWRRLVRIGRSRPHERARRLVLGGTTLAVLGAAWWAQHALVSTTAALMMPPPGATYWWVAAAWALLVIGIGLALASAARRLRRALAARWRDASGGWRGTPGRLFATVLLGAALTTAAAAPPGALDVLRKDLSPSHVMLLESPVGASRAFVRAEEVATPEAGAELAVDRLVAEGGLERPAILIVLPTGSGWVNAVAVNALEVELGGEVAVVSAQYDNLPSWWSFLIDQEPARRSARALVGDVLDRVQALPPEQRPDVYLYGESLGALAGQDALAAVPQQAVCGAIWAGAPGGAVSGHPRERILRNADDPVAHLSVDSALERPQDWPTLWLPGLSYATTVLDLGASLAPRPGHGHQYGGEQDWSLPLC